MHVVHVNVRWPAMVERDPDFNVYYDISIGHQDFVCIQSTNHFCCLALLRFFRAFQLFYCGFSFIIV